MSWSEIMTARIVLETERLRLRPVERADAEAIQRLVSERDIAATTLNIPHPYPEGGALEWIAQREDNRAQGKNINFAILRREDSVLIGGIGIGGSAEHQRMEMGYWIGKPYWNRGYATEAARRVVHFAFEELVLNKLTSSYFLNNPASGRVQAKAGLKLEATLRQQYRKWGEFVDVDVSSLLRSDYYA